MTPCFCPTKEHPVSIEPAGCSFFFCCLLTECYSGSKPRMMLKSPKPLRERSAPGLSKPIP